VRKKFKIKFLNHLTIVLFEYFNVAVNHRFDGEPLNLLRTAGLSLLSTRVQYFAILDNVCVCVCVCEQTRPNRKERQHGFADGRRTLDRIFASCGWRVFALHALLLPVGLIVVYQFFVSRDCPSCMLKLLAHVQEFAFTLMHETFIYHLTQSL
jgi:hypothetical protein